MVVAAGVNLNNTTSINNFLDYSLNIAEIGCNSLAKYNNRSIIPAYSDTTNATIDFDQIPEMNQAH